MATVFFTAVFFVSVASGAAATFVAVAFTAPVPVFVSVAVAFFVAVDFAGLFLTAAPSAAPGLSVPSPVAFFEEAAFVATAFFAAVFFVAVFFATMAAAPSHIL
ncbi:hypothetical protein [Streptomyces sp. NPDC126522]|uniref:hypothetical protein n=1 Tax=Streptomyces sp. NPDC126522 TaxID=3155211 RepID=UPI00333442D8